jgi:hypothetical protein
MSIGTVADRGYDVVCDYQAILLEDTRKYYYWNKLNGETTWEKPIALQQHEALMKVKEVESSKELDKEQLLEKQHVGKVCNFVSSIKLEIESKVDCEHDGPMKAPLSVLEWPVASPISNSHIGIQNDSHKDLEYRTTEFLAMAKVMQMKFKMTTISPHPPNLTTMK